MVGAEWTRFGIHALIYDSYVPSLDDYGRHGIPGVSLLFDSCLGVAISYRTKYTNCKKVRPPEQLLSTAEYEKSCMS
mgnify:FL=1|jgi:hypothetical protein